MAFTEQFESWLDEKLQTIKAVTLHRHTDRLPGPGSSLFQPDVTGAHVTSVGRVMTHRGNTRNVGSPAGNYYRFVYDDEDEDIPTLTADDINDEYSQGLTRRERISRLLGTELELEQSEAGDDDEEDRSRGQVVIDENENLYSSNAQRALNYSTTSLEFSDVDSYASANEGPVGPTWTAGNMADDAVGQNFSREPISYIEFSTVDNRPVSNERRPFARLESDGFEKRTAGANRGSRKSSGKRFDEMISVHYRKTDFDVDDGDFIDDDDMLRQIDAELATPVDVHTYGKSVRQHQGILPSHETDMVLEPEEVMFDTTNDDHSLAKDSDPIVRVESDGSRRATSSLLKRHRRLVLSVAAAVILVLMVTGGVVAYFIIRSMY